MPAPTYRPACVLNLKLLFDDALLGTNAPAPTPQTTDARAQVANRGVLPALTTPINRRVVSADGAEVTFLDGETVTPPRPRRPRAFTGGDSRVSYVLNRVPKRGTVERPGYRQAGTFEFTIDFKDLPIAPQLIRSAAVEVHLGSVPDAAFAEGIERADARGVRASTLRTRNADNTPNRDTLAFVGLVDRWKIHHGERESEVTIAGRDLRALLIDSPMDPRALATLELGEDIVGVVEQLLDIHPLGDQFEVVADESEWPNGRIPSPMGVALAPRHRRGARGRRRSARANPPGRSQQFTYWDMVVRFCYLCGAIPYFEGYQLFVRPARSLYAQRAAGTPINPTPFDGGRPRSVDAETDGALDPALRVRRMVYGRNIATMEFERRFGGGARPKTVRVVTTDTSATARGARGQVLTAEWPAADAPERVRRTRVAPSGGQAQQEVLNVPVAGVRDLGRLQQIARAVFEEIGRGEVTGSCETKSLASFGGDARDADLLRLRPGDAVEFLTDVRAGSLASPLVASLVEFERDSLENVVRALAARLGDERLARAIVVSSRGSVRQVQRFFRTSTVKYEWSTERGIQVRFDFQNFVEAVFDPEPAHDARARAAARTAAEVSADGRTITFPDETVRPGRLTTRRAPERASTTVTRDGREITFNQDTLVPAPGRGRDGGST